VRRLIVNADDFGLTAGVNRAVAELHFAGAVTSATLMAGAPAAGGAMEIARSTPSLGVGCHVVLTGGVSVLDHREISSLVDPASGRFHATLSLFLRHLLAGRIREEEIEAEIAAQIRRVQLGGVTLTHIDTHKHTHVLPFVLRPLLRAACACGIRAIRNPFEPRWSRRTAEHAAWGRRAQVRGIELLAGRFHRIVEEAGFVTTNGALGLVATGILNESILASLLRMLPEGTWELVSHPGYNDADLGNAGTRLKESRESERRALLGTIPGAGVELVSFAALNKT